MLRPILIIEGQKKSIFLEIFFKSLKRKIKSPLILISSKKRVEKFLKKNSLNKNLKLINEDDLVELKLNNKSINLIDLDKDPKFIKKKYSYTKASFEVAFRLIKKGLVYKIINGPINKEQFLNKKYLGMTEYISDKLNHKKIGMLIYNKKLSVCPLTTHLPLKEISKNINVNNILDKIDIIKKFYKNTLHTNPNIAVTCLNPHCESVMKFNEDKEILKKAVKLARKKNIKVNGPFSSDTLFLKANRKKFNVILGMYHDQVLGPFKSIFEFDSINITMGLPILRVSPDHGPNEHMVGKNKSNPLSLIRCLEFLDKK